MYPYTHVLLIYIHTYTYVSLVISTDIPFQYKWLKNT